MLDNADLGFVGVTRNETTFEPELYTDKLPADIGDRPVIIVDPMLATGGSLNHVIDLIANRQVKGRSLWFVQSPPRKVSRRCEPTSTTAGTFTS